jgi:hypothetical protein
MYFRVRVAYPHPSIAQQPLSTGSYFVHPVEGLVPPGSGKISVLTGKELVMMFLPHVVLLSLR